MRKADIDDMGIIIRGRNITDFRYADDTTLHLWPMISQA